MKKIFILLAVLVLAACSSHEALEKGSRKEDIKQVKVLENEISKGDIIIDTRSYDEFNGWDIDKSGASGHIPGSYNIPWNLNEEDMDKIIKRNNLDISKIYVLYGDNTELVSEKLNNLGYNTSISNVSPEKWEKSGNELDKLKNKKVLLPVSWVKDLMDGKKVENYDGRPVAIFNVGWDKTQKTHKKGHIPGSYWVHTGWVEVGPLWNRVSDEKISEELAKLGVTPGTMVIVYGDPMAAARFGVIAKYMGVEDVRMINGGLEAWKAAGYDVATDEKLPTPVESFGTDKALNPGVIIDIDEAKDYLKEDGSDLVSIRSWKEYLGKVSGYDYIKPRGRIEGAKWGKAGSDPWHLEDYRAINSNYMRPYNEVEKMWKDLKINPQSNLAFYCGTGWRASEVWIYADAMGLKNISVYDGGWKEWSENPETKKHKLKGEPVKLNEEKYID